LEHQRQNLRLIEPPFVCGCFGKKAERYEAVDVLQRHQTIMPPTLSEIKSQPQNHIFFKNLRALRAGGIESTQQKKGDACRRVNGWQQPYHIWGGSHHEPNYNSLAKRYVLGNVTISKAYLSPTSPYEKWGLGIQFMAFF